MEEFYIAYSQVMPEYKLYIYFGVSKFPGNLVFLRIHNLLVVHQITVYVEFLSMAFHLGKI